jgi:hypothetical protein
VKELVIVARSNAVSLAFPSLGVPYLRIVFSGLGQRLSYCFGAICGKGRRKITRVIPTFLLFLFFDVTYCSNIHAPEFNRMN